MTISDENAVAHGVQDCYWDNLGWGFRIHCLCGWSSDLSIYVEACGESFDWHLLDVGQAPPPRRPE